MQKKIFQLKIMKKNYLKNRGTFVSINHIRLKKVLPGQKQTSHHYQKPTKKKEEEQEENQPSASPTRGSSDCMPLQPVV